MIGVIAGSAKKKAGITPAFFIRPCLLICEKIVYTERKTYIL